MKLRQVIAETIRTLPPASKRRVAGVWLILSAATFVEAAGLAFWYPVVMMVAQPEAAKDSPSMIWLGEFLGAAGPRELTLTLLWMGIAICVFVAVVRILATLVTERVVSQERTSFSVRLLQAYLTQPYEWLLARNTADLSREVVDEAPNIVGRCLMSLFRLYSASSLSFVLFAGMIYADPWIALSSLLVLGVLFGAVYLQVKPRIATVADARFERDNHLARRVIEAILAVREARVPPEESHFVRRVQDQQRAVGSLASRHQLLSDVPGTATEVTARLGILLAALYLLVIEHPHALALVAVYVMAVVRIAPEIRNIFTVASQLQTEVPLLVRFRLFLQGDRPGPEECVDRLDLHSSLRVEGVSFAYEGREGAVLQDVTLEIPFRSSLALVGETGSGKSTLAGILAGLLTPVDGRVLVDDRVLDELGRRAWRNNVGYVPQEVYMIQATVGANIALGIPEDEVDQARLAEVAEAAGAMEFIDQLEYGLGHWLQERGASLSGGQRQRIALARALYHDPEVLVLDEATSSLDNRTERVVLDALERLSEEKTLVVIAHRLTTVRHCDRVCLVEDGRVVAAGTFDELEASSPRFAAMVEAGSLEPTRDEPRG